MTQTFNEILQIINVAYSQYGAKTTNKYQNLCAQSLLTVLKRPLVGEKDGSHFIRTALKVDTTGKCLPRKNENTESLARLIVLDCDSRIDKNGEILTGAPCPDKVATLLRQQNIGYVLFGTYSHYIRDKGHRYRVLLATDRPYNKQILPSTIEAVMNQINAKLEGAELASVIENCSFSQPWYIPRKPTSNIIYTLYHEHLLGNPIPAVEPPPTDLPAKSKTAYSLVSSDGASPIAVFNAKNPIETLLTQYGYEQRSQSQKESRWLAPNSTSGQCGITVRDGKLFSHHSGALNDGYWHDSFDLFCAHEKLTAREAVGMLQKKRRN